MDWIINPEIRKYLDNLFPVDDMILVEMEKFGKNQDFPIIDKYTGRFLYLISKLKNPELIVELGSGFGYSAYWFAKGLGDGKVVLIDYQEKNINKAKEFFKKGSLLEKAEFRIGDAVEIAKNYRNIDILFLDLEKMRYLDAIKTLENNLSEDGIILADNVLWHGKIASNSSDKKSLALREFNEYMSKNFSCMILPIGDGLLIATR
ncbi:O-methyltransferase [Persephonella sp.]